MGAVGGVFDDPTAAGGRVVDGVVEPIEEAYEEGGALEAVGYGAVSGLTKSRWTTGC